MLSPFDCLAEPWHGRGVLHSLDRVVLAVPELDPAVRQYARLLGRMPSWRGEQPVAGTENSLFRLDNVVLEIVAPTSDGGRSNAGPSDRGPSDTALSGRGGADGLRGWLDAHGEGLLALTFATDDVDELRRHLVDRGLQPTPVEKKIDRDVESGAFRRWRQVGLSPAATRGVLLAAVQNESPDDMIAQGSPLGPAPASVFALDHTVVQTRDADATKSLYGDGLGLRLALDREFPKWRSRLQFFRVGGVTVEVAATIGEAPAAESVAADAPLDRDRLWGLCWRVRDAASAQARMRANGFDVSEVRDGRKPGTRVFTVRAGTCGVPTLVLEPPQG